MHLKHKIQSSFSKAAHTYNKSATLQNKVADNVVKIANQYIKEHDHILDLGCGSGFLGDKILATHNVKFVASDISLQMLEQVSDKQEKIHCDFEKLPFLDQSFDIVISSFSLQWALDFEQLFAQTYRVLKHNAPFIFAIPLDGSLQEIKNLGVGSINHFPNDQFLTDKLTLAHFDIIHVEKLSISQRYHSPIMLLKNIKNLGAHLAIDNNDNKNSLASLRKISDFQDSWELGYFICRKRHV